MSGKPSPKADQGMDKAIKDFLVHFIIFLGVNAIILVIPVFYDGNWDFSFEDRGPMLYGSIGWGIGVAIHGLVVLSSRLAKK